MPYPDWTAGAKITGSRLRDGQPIEAQKTTDQDVISSSVLEDDTELWVPVVQGATYRGTLTLFYVAPTANDLKYAWASPSGSAGRRGVFGPAATTPADVSATDFQDRVSGALETEFSLGGAGGSHKMAVERILFTAGLDGTLQLQWAQAVAGGTSTVLTYSHLVLWRMS